MIANTDQITKDIATVRKALKDWKSYTADHRRGGLDSQNTQAHSALAAFERLILTITLQQKEMKLLID